MLAMPEVQERRPGRKGFRFIPDELVPIYEHNLKEYERLLKNPDSEPNWKTVPFDQKGLEEKWERVMASIKRPAQAASAGSA